MGYLPPYITHINNRGAIPDAQKIGYGGDYRSKFALIQRMSTNNEQREIDCGGAYDS